MKRILTLFFMLFLLGAGRTFSQVVIDLSTGVTGSGTLISSGNADDTWTVGYSGTSPGVPPSYQPAYCTPSINPSDPNTQFIVPNYSFPLLEPGGYYYYKMTFDYPDQCVVSAVLSFSYIGGDDKIDEISVNGHIYTVNYGTTPFASNITITVPNNKIAAPGQNEIILRAYNIIRQTNPLTRIGIQVNGKLTIQNTPMADASFCLSVSGGTLQAQGDPLASNTWDVYESAPGFDGNYSHIGTYNQTNLQIPNSNHKCYMVRHTVSGVCGTDCSLQKVCKQSCDDDCNISVPEGLYFDKNTIPNVFYWNAVQGAVSYEIEMIPNDPACCGNGAIPVPIIVPVSGTSYQQMQDIPGCFSWKVSAICQDGTKKTSPIKCE